METNGFFTFEEIMNEVIYVLANLKTKFLHNELKLAALGITLAVHIRPLVYKYCTRNVFVFVSEMK